MSVQRPSPPPPPPPSGGPEPDLEITAELPVLDVAAFEAAAAADERLGNTDTWIMPPQALRSAPVVGPPADGASAVSAHIAIPAQGPTGGDEHRSQLEINLQALSANLREVEEHLKRKGEHLAELERSVQEARKARDIADERSRDLQTRLEASQAETAAARAQEATARAESAAAQERIAELQRLADERNSASSQPLRVHDTEFATQLAAKERSLLVLRRDLEEARALAARYLEALQSVEGWRKVSDGIIAGLHHEADTRDVRIDRLEKDLLVAGARARELKSELRSRTGRVAKLEKEINRFATALAQRDERLREVEREKDELRQSMTPLRAQLAARNQRIQELESAATQENASASQRRTELEGLGAERSRLSAEVQSLQGALSAATARAEEQEGIARKALSRCDELEIALAGQRRRTDQLEAELVSVRNELQERTQALEEATQLRSEHLAQIAATDARIQELEERAAEQQDSVRVLQADSNASIARSKELEADLRAAEDTIHRLEGELRVRAARLDELERTNHEWRITMEEARHALTDRENLILRLEEEAANSTVLLGAIRQSITHLDHSAADREPAPDGATRLLIRSDGEREVVHVLGRKTTVGRTPDNDLQIDAKFISRHHAVILAGPAHTIIEDLNSTNGVLINGRRITRQTMKDGDSVVIGKTQFRFAVRLPADKR